MNRPRHPRTDANQAALIRDCRALGMIVWDTSRNGGQVLDLVVHWRGVTRVVEVKRLGHEDEFTANEADSILALASVGIVAIVATCVEDVVKGWEEER